MEKTMKQFIFRAVMLTAVFLMSAFLFPAGAQVVEVDEYEEMKALLEDPTSSPVVTITITEDMDITGQINVHPNITTLTIDGIKSGGGGTYTLNGGGSYSFLKVGKIDLTLINITIENCNGSDGAVIYADQPDTKITLKDSVFSSNIAEYGSGGVVYQEGGTGESPAESNTLTIERCTFTENGNEWFHGGVIYQRQYARLKVSNSSFTDNFSEEDGGAISQGDDCRMVIENTTFKGNISNYAMGGAVFQNERCSMEISGSEFSGNEAYYQGGAVYQGDDSELTVTGSVFSRNKADERGGAICQKEGAVMTLQDCQFLENESDVGGAVYAPTNAEVTGTGSETCLFSGNKAGSYGGALEYGQDLTITGCTFRENGASVGGALASPWDRIFLESDYEENYYFTQEGLVGTVVISDSHFIENTADYGGVWYDSAGFDEELFGEDTYVYYDEDKGKYYYLTIEELLPVIVVNPDGSETRYDEAGSKIYFDEACGSKITVSGTEFIDNTANVHGGVFFLNNLQTTKIKEDNVFSGNSAPNGSGGVIYNRGEGELTVSGSEFTKNSAGVTDAICYSDENGIVSFEDNTFTGNTVGSNGGWVFALGGNTTIRNNEFYANTDTDRDMLFKDADDDDEISGNTYRGNFLEDAFSSPDPDAEIAYDTEIEVTLDLRKVYNDYVRDGAVRISINGNKYGDFDVTDGKAVIKINGSDLENGVNDIKAEYISGEYNEGEYTEGYYHYQQPELTFKIRKTAETYHVTVTTEGKGTASSDPVSGPTGTEVTLTAKPDDGWQFREWKVIESGGGTLNGDTFTIGTGDAEIAAVFEEEASEEYQVTVTVEGKGTASADPVSGPAGTEVTLTAEPDDRFIFKEWKVIESGGGTLKGDTFTIGTGDAEIEAVFEEEAPVVYHVTVTTDGNGTASADPESGPTGTEVTLTAKPDDGWRFREWKVIESGGGTLNGDTFTIGTGDAEIAAVFEEEASEEYQVTVTVEGKGTASADPVSGPTGTEVTLTAEPKDGWRFREWKVIESGGGVLRAVRIDTEKNSKAASFTERAYFTIGTGDAEIAAVFIEDVPEEYQVAVTVEGNGTAAADPVSGPTGTIVTLTAEPGDGWQFKEWKIVESGGGTLKGNTFTIGVGSARIVAVFEKTEEPQPPEPPKPICPCCELPRTGITGAGISLTNKPASLNYDPIGMELYIPKLDLVSDIVTVPLTEGGYPVEWLGNDAGLLEGFAKPGSGISVIAGHNTLNAEEYGPFALLNTLEAGDVLFVRRSNGELKRFTVYLNEKIGAEDIEGLQRAAGMYENTLTLLTCEDELAGGGYASRRIVSAK